MLDAFDRRILAAIQDDPDMTMRTLAERTGLSHTPCWRRLNRMQEAGIVSAKRYIVNAAALGYEITLFCSVRMKEHKRDRLNAFEAAVKRVPEVVQCYSVTGTYDYLLRVLAQSVGHYEATLKDRLVELPNVAEINSTLTLREVKNTPDAPI